MLEFFDCGYGYFNAQRPIEPSCWDRFDLLWIHTGRVAIRLMEEPPLHVGPHEGVLIYPHTPFEGEALSASSRASIQHFSITNTQRQNHLLAPFVRLLGKRVGYEYFHLHEVDALEELIHAALQLAAMEQSRLVHDLRVARLALILGHLELARIQQPEPGPYQDRLSNLIQRLRQHPEQAMSLLQMAARLDLSVSHFRAVFRDRVGQTPGQFQMHVRMQEAARLLRDSDWPIKRIATHLGFDELPNFYRRFKSIHGQPPRQYRDDHAPRA